MRKILLTALLCLVAAGSAQAANEFVVHEYPTPYLTKNGYPIPIYPPLVTSQFLDIAELSAAFNAKTTVIEICNLDDATMFYKIGASDVAAVANTAGNGALGTLKCKDIAVSPGQYIDNAQ